jgi:organic radical activating enzyme
VKNYCPLPFRHVFVEPRGIKPCCSYTVIKQVDIQKWLESDALRDLQKNILEEKIDVGCRSCFEKESTDGISTRLSALQDYQNERFESTSIDYIDYRSSNVCNFKCRSCEPFFSNGIANEINKHKSLAHFFAIPDKKVAPTSTTDKKWIIDNIRSIKRLMFTGGEPTKIPEVRQIIDHISQFSDVETNLLITSNGSFTDSYWKDITKSLRNIHWTMSVDAIGSPAEIIRHGTVWPTVAKNVETMFDIAQSVNIGTIVTNLNLLHLPELFDFANNLYQKYRSRANGGTHLIEICLFPDYMSPYNLPDSLKNLAISRLSQYAGSRKDLQESQIHVIETLITNLKTRIFDQALWDKFREYNNALDSIRGEDHHMLFR